MEHWEPLGRRLKVLVNERHRFNTDTLLLAHFSMPRPRERCADIGSGCGAIPLLWCARGEPGHVVALELQEEAVGLLRRTVRENGLDDRIAVLQGDARDYKALLPHQGLERVACNPPYFPVGSGAQSRKEGRALARHEEALTLEVLAQCARYALKTGGRLCFCLPAGRLAEAAGIFHAHGLEPKRLRLVQLDQDHPPYLFLMECRRSGKPGLQVEATLFLRDGAGKDSPELIKIYGDYLDNALQRRP